MSYFSLQQLIESSVIRLISIIFLPGIDLNLSCYTQTLKSLSRTVRSPNLLPAYIIPTSRDFQKYKLSWPPLRELHSTQIIQHFPLATHSSLSSGQQAIRYFYVCCYSWLPICIMFTLSIATTTTPTTNNDTTDQPTPKVMSGIVCPLLMAD